MGPSVQVRLPVRQAEAASDGRRQPRRLQSGGRQLRRRVRVDAVAAAVRRRVDRFARRPSLRTVAYHRRLPGPLQVT